MHISAKAAKPSFQLPDQPNQIRFMSDNSNQINLEKVNYESLTTHPKRLSYRLVDSMPYYVISSHELDGFILGGPHYKQSRLTCSIPGSCLVFADAPRSAEADKTETALSNLVWALDQFGERASMMHPRLTRALSAAKKLTQPDVGYFNHPPAERQ